VAISNEAQHPNPHCSSWRPPSHYELSTDIPESTRLSLPLPLRGRCSSRTIPEIDTPKIASELASGWLSACAGSDIPRRSDLSCKHQARHLIRQPHSTPLKLNLRLSRTQDKNASTAEIELQLPLLPPPPPSSVKLRCAQARPPFVTQSPSE
jgi:hypothetical protein